MKKYLLLILCLVSSLMASAESGTCGANLTWSLEDGILVISGTGDMTNYRYPSFVPWYSSRSTISLAIISDGVTSIGDYAFYGCRGLTSITIPNSVTSIGDNAFSHCSGLTSITIPNSVTSIGKEAFYRCEGLTSITIPNSVTSIGNGAFLGCSGLPVIDNVRYADCVAVEAIDKNQSAYVIKEGTRFIHSYAFSGCSGLTSVTIPNSVTSIGDNAFSGCSGLTSINIPNSVTSIGNYAFYNCSGLTSVTIPNSVTSIGRFAFEGCSGLTSVNITDLASWCNIDFVDREANPTYYVHKLVLNGTEIKDLVIPEKITEIKNYAFSGCSGLTSVTIPNSVTSIGVSAFEGCSGLTSINIPNSVTSIGNYAFRYCSGLTSINIPNSVTSIGYQAFQGCSGLTSVTIPNSVTSIEGSAFSDCSGLTSVTIPNSVTSIGNGAFLGCIGLPVIDNIRYADCVAVKAIDKNQSAYVIKEGTRFIHSSAFSGCSGLTSVTIPNSVTSIGDGAFYGCYGLTSITIPNSVTSIGMEAFYDCSGLTSVTIPNSILTMGSRTYPAFWNCPMLTDVNISCVDDNDFFNYLQRTDISSIFHEEGLSGKNHNIYIGGKLQSAITIPNSVTNIANHAFKDCSLESLTIGENVEAIGLDAFAGCTNIKTIYALPTIPPLCESEFEAEIYNNTTLYIPNTNNAYIRYTGANIWNKFRNITERVMTGIDHTYVKDIKSINYYNLNGKRATSATRGINIVNGKKVFVQ